MQHDLERIELSPLYFQISNLKEKLKISRKWIWRGLCPAIRYVKTNSENEQRNKLTPSQEKEKLMKQVKNDNDM